MPGSASGAAGSAARFDLRAEFATAAAQSDPLALYSRLDRLLERFEHERSRSPRRPRGRVEQTENAGAAISGELDGAGAVAPARVEPVSGSLPLPHAVNNGEQRRHAAPEMPPHQGKSESANGTFSGAIPLPTEQRRDVEQHAAPEAGGEPEPESSDAVRLAAERPAAAAAAPTHRDESAPRDGDSAEEREQSRGRHAGMTGSLEAGEPTASPAPEQGPARFEREDENPTLPLGSAADILGLPSEQSASDESAVENGTDGSDEIAESGRHAPVVAQEQPAARSGPVVESGPTIEPGPTAAMPPSHPPREHGGQPAPRTGPASGPLPAPPPPGAPPPAPLPPGSRPPVEPPRRGNAPHGGQAPVRPPANPASGPFPVPQPPRQPMPPTPPPGQPAPAQPAQPARPPQPPPGNGNTGPSSAPFPAPAAAPSVPEGAPATPSRPSPRQSQSQQPQSRQPPPRPLAAVPEDRDVRNRPSEPSAAPTPQPPRYEPRPDGGFGPMGSGGWSGSGNSNYTAKGKFQQDPAEQGGEERPRTNELRSGQGYNRDDDEEQPRFLVQADDLHGTDFGSDRLVAPPVIGEGPPGYPGF
ncbi:hypothetical protein [Actinopolyspora lacussalsi]|nr:hypothetical protein [Actinopolyspora righensis]